MGHDEPAAGDAAGPARIPGGGDRAVQEPAPADRRRESFPPLAVPAENRIDAIQSYDEETDSGVAVVSRAQAAQSSYVLRPRGLRPEALYTITLESGARTLAMNGAQLMRDGVRVSLPTPMSSDVVYIDPRD